VIKAYDRHDQDLPGVLGATYAFHSAIAELSLYFGTEEHIRQQADHIGEALKWAETRSEVTQRTFQYAESARHALGND